MAKQKAVKSCVHDPDSPVNNWPFKQCFSFVPPKKTPVIPVETLFFLAANCCFWLLLIIFFYSSMVWDTTDSQKNISDDCRMQKKKSKTEYRYHYLLHALIYFLLNDYFVLKIFYFLSYWILFVFPFVNSIIILMSHFWSALHGSKRNDWNDSKVFRRQVVRRMTCRSVRFAAAKAKTPFIGFGVCLNLCVFVCLCV